MARTKNTKTHNIFLMDESKLPRIDGARLPTTDAIAQIMARDEKYELQTLKPDVNTHGFTVCLYFRGDDNYQSKFSSFCKAFVADGEEAVTFYPRSASSVLFIWNDRYIYAITTGQGFRMVEDYAVPKFGLIVASIFEEQFKVTSLDSNAMSSIVHSTKTIYSNEVDFIDIDALDTVFKEVIGRLKDKDKVHGLLNLKSDSQRNSMKITAKNYVQFSSSLSFDGLLHILQVISEYDFENLSDHFNLIAPILPKKHKDTIRANDEAVIHAMYEAFVSGSPFPFDLMNKESTKYISAEEYTIYDPDNARDYISKDDFEASALIYDAFREFLNGVEPSEGAFYLFATSSKIRSQTEEYVRTDGKLMQHISGEICVNGINYYIFYGDYYRLHTSYDDRLKASLRGKLRKEFITHDIQTRWAHGENEDEFNLHVSQNEGYVHMHKVLMDKVEFCDLLKQENDTITVVHVKDKFDGAMRILDRQVELSVAKLMDLKHNNNTTYMRNLYQKACGSNVGLNIQTVFPTEQDFVDSMKDCVCQLETA